MDEGLQDISDTPTEALADSDKGDTLDSDNIAEVPPTTQDMDTHDDVVDITEDDEITNKPVLKLARFADLGSNGITDDTPVAAMGAKPTCEQCGRPNHDTFAPLIWETMQFCSLDCMSK